MEISTGFVPLMEMSTGYVPAMEMSTGFVPIMIYGIDIHENIY